MTVSNASAAGDAREVVACVGLGGNLGDAGAMLASAFDALAELPHTRLVSRSRLFRTPAWGVAAQPDFVNAAAMLATRLLPAALLTELLRIEREAGRDRDREPQRWGPRALDLDLLTYGDATIALPGLCVPHPHLHERAFVLVPLAEIAPDLVVPDRGRVAALRAAIDAQGIVPLVE